MLTIDDKIKILEEARVELGLVDDKEKLVRYDTCVEVLRETIEEHYSKCEVLMDLRNMIFSALSLRSSIDQYESLLKIARTILEDFYGYDVRMIQLSKAIGKMLGSKV